MNLIIERMQSSSAQYLDMVTAVAATGASALVDAM